MRKMAWDIYRLTSRSLTRTSSPATATSTLYQASESPVGMLSLTSYNRWLYTPRGSAVFYVPSRNQHLMRSSLPTSHWYEPVPRPGKQPTPNPLPPSTKSNFVQQFEFVGTVDNASLLCIPAALKFREEICGGEETGKSHPSGI